MKKEFDSEPIYNEKYVKTKIKSCQEKTTANFYVDNATKEGSQCICLPVILINFYSCYELLSSSFYKRM